MQNSQDILQAKVVLYLTNVHQMQKFNPIKPQG